VNKEMATERQRWENIKELGSGGQGNVYLVRRPESGAEYQKAAKRIQDVLMSVGGGLAPERVKALATDIFFCGRPEEKGEVAALKDFVLEGRDQEQAIKRLEAEIKALRTIQHPAILKLLDASVDEASWSLNTFRVAA
jgi:serine/threonine protein kinase